MLIFSVIVADAGSADNTTDIIDKHKNKIRGLKYIYQNNRDFNILSTGYIK